MLNRQFDHPTAGLFFIGYLAQFPAGIACLALGVRRWLTLIITAWSVVAALFAAIENEAQFLVLRFFLGLAEAGTYPAIYAQLTHFFDPDGLGLAYTWYEGVVWWYGRAWRWIQKMVGRG